MNLENDGRLYFYYKKDVIYEQIWRTFLDCVKGKGKRLKMKEIKWL